jgi:hypothetical protein
LNPAGIIAEEVVEPMPAVLKALCRRLVRWRILPPDREPDTAIVNVYDTGAIRSFVVRQIWVSHDTIREHCSLLCPAGCNCSSECTGEQHDAILQVLGGHRLLRVGMSAPSLCARTQGTASRRTSTTTTSCAPS